MLAFLAMVIVPILMLYEGLVLHLMWGWFITHTFGVVQPNILTCVGLSAIVALVTPHTVPTYKEPEKAIEALCNIMAKCTVTLFAGFVLHFFI